VLHSRYYHKRKFLLCRLSDDVGLWIIVHGTCPRLKLQVTW